MEAVLHNSYDCLLLKMTVNLERRGSFTLGETSVVVLKKKKTDCRKGTPGDDPLFVNIR